MGKTITGISVELAIVKKAKAIAKSSRRTFSNYVEGLLLQDQKRLITSSTNHVKKKVVPLKRRKKK